MNACLAEACGVPSYNKLLDSIGFEGTLEALYECNLVSIHIMLLSATCYK
jgi:hypothetical protein